MAAATRSVHRRVHARYAPTTVCQCQRRRSTLLTAPVIAASSSRLLASQLQDDSDAARASPHTQTQPRPSPTTLIRQLVPGEQMYVYEQAFTLGVITTPLRSTVIALENGYTVWLHNPVQLTEEIHRHILSLIHRGGASDGGGGTGTTRQRGRRERTSLHVVCGTYALEHCQYARMYAEAFTDAFDKVEVWVQGKEGSDVANILVDALDDIRAIFRNQKTADGDTIPVRVIGNDDAIEWADEIEFETLELGTQANVTFRETVFFHKRTRSLIVSDVLIFISGHVPDELVIPKQTLQIIAKRSTLDDTPDASSASTLFDGYRKLTLLTLYFTPEHEELAVRLKRFNNNETRWSITEANQADTVPPILRQNDDASMLPEVFQYWSSGWEENFDAIRGRLLVSPVSRILIFELPVSTLLINTSSKDRRLRRLRSLRDFVDRVIARWPGPWSRIVSSHFDVADEKSLVQEGNVLGHGRREDGLVKNAFREAFRFVDAAMLESDDNRLDAGAPYAFNEGDLRVLRALQRKFL